MRKLIRTLFSLQLDLRVRLFNILATVGILLSVYAGAVMLRGGEAMRACVCLCAAVFSVLLMLYARRSGKYERCYHISVAVIFFGLFTVLLVTGGVNGSLLLLPLLGVLFTVMLLKGLRGLLVACGEIFYYVAVLVLLTLRTQQHQGFSAVDMGLGFFVHCGALTVCIFSMMQLYDRQQKELEEANNALHELNRMKTEFLQDIKHEIRNPLHVISLGTDYVKSRIGAPGGAEEALGALDIIQNEAIRLGRMVNGMVELATMSDSPKNREKVDFAALLRHCAETARLQAEQSKNTLRVELAPDLPYVYAEAEQLERVPVNLLSNAVNATENGEIALEASVESNYITVRVRDTGEGIPPALLPRVFERGVSGKGGKGGKGYGLAICKTIVEAHGGEIKIKSGQGKGTAVTFTIPVYGGQSEGRA